MGGILETILETLVRARLSDTLREYTGILLGCALVAASGKVAGTEGRIVATFGVAVAGVALCSYSYRLLKSHNGR